MIAHRKVMAKDTAETSFWVSDVQAVSQMITTSTNTTYCMYLSCTDCTRTRTKKICHYKFKSNKNCHI